MSHLINKNIKTYNGYNTIPVSNKTFNNYNKEFSKNNKMI